MSPRQHTDSFLIDHFFPTHFPDNMTEHHGIPPNSNTSSYLSIYSNLLTSLDHPTNSFVAVNNFPTHFLLNVREHHGIASVVFPWCLLGVPWDPFTKEHQGGTPRNTRGFRFCSECSGNSSTIAMSQLEALCCPDEPVDLPHSLTIRRT